MCVCGCAHACEAEKATEQVCVGARMHVCARMCEKQKKQQSKCVCVCLHVKQKKENQADLPGWNK